jgi:lipopolysaccharide transport system permease protein
MTDVVHGSTTLATDCRIAWAIARRDLRARYSSSRFGLLWLVLSPIALACVYWLVFGIFLRVNWAPELGPRLAYLLPFLAGMSIYLLLVDVVNSSISLYAGKRNFLKKSPTPLAVFWLANCLRALTQNSVLIVLTVGLAATSGALTPIGLIAAAASFSITVAFLAGFSAALAIVGPFLPDLREAASLVLRVLLYLAPVTYPMQLVPEQLRAWLWLNPVTAMIEPWREALIFGRVAAWPVFCAFAAASAAACLIGAWMHRRAAGAVVDVV